MSFRPGLANQVAEIQRKLREHIMKCEEPPEPAVSTLFGPVTKKEDGK